MVRFVEIAAAETATTQQAQKTPQIDVSAPVPETTEGVAKGQKRRGPLHRYAASLSRLLLSALRFSSLSLRYA